ncbi:MAG: YihY/virulence factor BrkB family protein [Betaproteobacteria bacterium]
MNFRLLIDLSKAAVSGWKQDFAPSMGAALAYYTVFSIAPLLIIAIAIAALAFGQQAAQHEILAQARDLMGAEGAAVLESMLNNAQKPGEGILAATLSVITLIVGSIGVFNELETDLNRIWKVDTTGRAGIMGFIRDRVLSFGMVIAIGFLLLISLVVNAALAAGGRYWAELFPGLEAILQVANFMVSFAVITAAFAIVYKFLPQTRIAWKDVWAGAAITALLFTVGRFLIALYIGKTSTSSSYGAAGALVVLLVWVYYSAQIFLLGAEFTKVYADRHGSLRGAEKKGPIDAAA